MIEDMDGLFVRMPRLAMCMIIGIAGMFLAPFGMLISKWATMTSFVDSGNFLLVGIICFGSAVTAFYWVKWLGKLSAVVANEPSIEHDVWRSEIFVHITLTVLTVIVCLSFQNIAFEKGSDFHSVIINADTVQVICCGEGSDNDFISASSADAL